MLATGQALFCALHKPGEDARAGDCGVTKTRWIEVENKTYMPSSKTILQLLSIRHIKHLKLYVLFA